MTPTEIVTAARNKYNSVGDNFFSDSEIYGLIYQACLEMSNECPGVIETSSTSATVSGTQSYVLPTYAIQVKRLTYDGAKLTKINMREDDALTMLNQSTTATGTPQYYYEWADYVYLRPIPDAVGTLKFFTYNEPQSITVNSTLEVPTQFHSDIVNYVVSEMCAKDENYTAATFYENKWQKGLSRVKRFLQKKKKGDSFSQVQNEETLPGTFLGIK